MIRHLIATTALTTMVVSGAFAQTQPAPADPATPSIQQVVPAEGHLATNLIGENVYNGTGDNAEKIGDVNDLVFDKDGKLASIVIGVGGFLGIGEKDVALAYDKIDWAEKDADRWIVVPATKEELTALPAFDRTAFVPKGTAATAPTTSSPAATDTSAKPVDKSTLKEMPAGEIRAEELVGTTVYGANDEHVGEIGDVILGADNKVDSIIIDVGGFLGMGEKEVAVALDNLAFMADADNKRYLYTNFTKEQLEAQPAYDKATYAEKREEQRLILRN